MLGLKFSRLVHASLAGGSLALSGCVDRAYDFGVDPIGDTDSDTDTDTDTDGTTDDPNPTTSPTDPTTDPTPPPPPPSMPGPPQLIDAQFVDNLTLQLTFTEAIAPATAVDPRQFRLSAGFGSQVEEYYFYGTFYQEVGQFNNAEEYCGEYCYEYCDYDVCYYECFEYCYAPPGPPVRVNSIVQVPERPEVVWLTFDNPLTGKVCDQLDANPEGFVSELFIHYTASGAAPITDNDGEVLASISEPWVLRPEEDFYYVEGFFSLMNPFLPIPCVFQ